MYYYRETIADQAWSLYVNVLKDSYLPQLPYASSDRQYSAYNLTSFLAYKKHMSAELFSSLNTHGFHISNIEHTTYTLQTICRYLGVQAPAQSGFIDLNQNMKNRRSAAIFGPHVDGSPKVMVTLDKRMISSPIIEELLIRGMGVARINCAYDTEEDWLGLIESIRIAERNLRNKGLYENRECKIYMDLAGPKIRIGPIKSITNPLAVKVKKSGTGDHAQKSGLILCSDRETDPNQLSQYDFLLQASPQEGILRLTPGDQLLFQDARNKRRSLHITEIKGDEIRVSLDATAYISEGTKLYCNEREVELHVNRMHSHLKRKRVKKGDLVGIAFDGYIHASQDEVSPSIWITVNLPEAFAHVETGNRIYFDDGKIQGIVNKRTEQYLEVEITFPSAAKTLEVDKGINLPDSDLSVPFLLEKDVSDLKFICPHADLVGVSFVRHPADLVRFKELMKQHGREDLSVIAKIETKEAVSHFSDILLTGLTFPHFGVMIARGDLAVEIGFQQLSVVQEEILSMCRAAHIPAILATQVLDALAKEGIPSRPELADVSFGSEFDCIMLNKGRFVKEAVEFLLNTLQMISQAKNYKQAIARV